MKIVVGHKVVNLEELFNVSCLPAGQTEVIVDSQLNAELNTKGNGDAKQIQCFPENINMEGAAEESVA
eukprot:CAMPEP_0176353742 /NCGR_PEP_ID=MMETSP0126-20121128/12024_1 /TAXON_ID=141414 ORGANISM="Strombidinopsis acuminatum, Strain SPMC142" /NCGR_SAMPLE_ID=MMETSP0126 /ASSEMBLY_ACC=CAM_ASM_000229 /LENGTH=67 /DNA_ID=CAMNT_0017705547 /DNA_START=15 /DNA_END=218 /DNA_ORIENTATION=+